MKRLSNLLFILIFSLVVAQAYAQGFLKAQGKKIVNNNGNVMLRGIGLGGWMLQEGYMLGISKDAQQHKIKERLQSLIGVEQTTKFYNLWLQNFIQKSDMDSMRAWGFNSIRLPLHYNLFTLPVDEEPVAGANTWLDKGFALTDSLLSWCKANHLYLFLDLHAAPGGQGNDLNISDRDATKPSLWQSDANSKKTIALWQKLATRYKNEEWIGGYDILNEPNWGFTDTVNDRNGVHEKDNSKLKKLYKDITAAIRSVDKKHLIIIEGNGWGNNYNSILPLWDDNMALSFHKYWDYNKPENIQRIVDARNKYNVPAWLGETGENSNVWYTEEITLLEKNNIGWCMWPLKKMGVNNPLEIRSNPDYEAVKKYFNEQGPRPTQSSAQKGVMQLAEDVKLQNNIFHKDVTDAMMRQPYSNKALPYHKNILNDSLTLNAVDYDLGRNGIAYFDLDTANYSAPGKSNVGNKGHQYRNDGVDIYSDSSENNTFYVGSIEDGEWLQYTIHVLQSKKYIFKLKVSSTPTGGDFSISVNGKWIVKNKHIGSVKLRWQTMETNEILLRKGINAIRFYKNEGSFNLKSLTLVKAPG